MSPEEWKKLPLLVKQSQAMAVLGCHWVCVFDPLVLLYRTTVTTLFPGTQWALEEGSTAIYRADPGIGPARLTLVTEPPYAFLRDHFFVDVRAVAVGGVEEIDAQRDGLAQYRVCRSAILGRPPHIRTADAHGAEAETIDRQVADADGGGHGSSLDYADAGRY